MIKEAFKESVIFGPYDFNPDSIKGILITIKYVFFVSKNQLNIEFTYFKGSSFGKFLHPGDTVLFYIEPNEVYSTGGIKGYGLVVESNIDTVEHIWEFYKNRNPILEKDVYFRYAQSKIGSTNMLAIVIKDFEEIELICDEDLKLILPSIAEEDNVGLTYIQE